jgi:hypothetical protein
MNPSLNQLIIFSLSIIKKKKKRIEVNRPHNKEKIMRK